MAGIEFSSLDTRSDCPSPSMLSPDRRKKEGNFFCRTYRLCKDKVEKSVLNQYAGMNCYFL